MHYLECNPLDKGGKQTFDLWLGRLWMFTNSVLIWMSLSNWLVNAKNIFIMFWENFLLFFSAAKQLQLIFSVTPVSWNENTNLLLYKKKQNSPDLCLKDPPMILQARSSSFQDFSVLPWLVWDLIWSGKTEVLGAIHRGKAKNSEDRLSPCSENVVFLCLRQTAQFFMEHSPLLWVKLSLESEAFWNY